ncbi:ABC-type transport auxiliary lipoprotein family protein [Undibacterium sp. SXout20W]|uniref:ABC-type transport auxiliary lipoprotein family protein n=1 Tax=Undibacterium sp. SXout20W TaxID=3413051 RepID=UPI003BF2D854
MSRFLNASHCRNDTRSLKKFSLISLLCFICGCSGNAALQRQQYDFGLPSSVSTTIPQTTAQVGLADIQVIPALDGNAMWYRLQYDNEQQLKAYAQARWSMPPAQLLTQRLKTRMLANGLQLVSSGDSVGAKLILHIEVDEFSQVFTSTSASHAQINLRAIVTKGKTVIAQRGFVAHAPSRSADAVGGARAMQEATDLLINEIQQWLTPLIVT